MAGMTGDPVAVAQRWVRAMSAHDVEAAVDCFDVDYVDEAPARRGESVHGQVEVRQNFVRLFTDIPDLRANLVGAVADGEAVWMEWQMTGTRADGTAMDFVGVNIFEVKDGRFLSGRIYTELVRDTGGIAAQLERMT